MTHVQIVVYQDYQVTFLEAAVYTSGLKLVQLKKLFHPKCKILHLPLLSYYVWGSCSCGSFLEVPFFQPVKDFLNGSATFLHIDCSPNLVSTINLLMCHSVPWTRLLMAFSNSIFLSVSLWVLPCIPICQLDLCHSSHFEFSGPANFPPTLQSTHPNHLSPVLALWVS